MIAEAKRRAADTKLPIRYEVGDAHKLQFPDNTFDRCFAFSVFMHLHDPCAALNELVRVTRPGGLIAIIEVDFFSA